MSDDAAPVVPAPTDGATAPGPVERGAGATSSARRVEPPWPLLVVALIVLVVNVVMSVVGSRTTPVTIDEAIHVDRMRTYLESGWYLPPFQMKGDAPAPASTDWTHIYGPATAIPSHSAAVALGAEDLGSISSSEDAYAARRLVVNALGVLGLLAVAVIARLLLRSWRWGLIAAAMLAVVPMWTGHGMFNVKDIPVATGCTLVTAGLIAIVSGGRRSTSFLGAFVLAAGAWLAIGTRPGIWPATALGIAVTLIGLLVLRTPPRDVVKVMGLMAAGLACAYAGLVAMYPNVFSQPITGAIQAVRSSAEFPGVNAAPTPWYYIPAWLGAQLPVLVILLAGAGAIASGVVIVRREIAPHATSAVLPVGMALVLTQAAALPLAAALRGSSLYNAARQVLFVVPAVAVLATVGLWAVLFVARRRSWQRPAVVAVTAAGLLLPTVASIRLFPFNYAFFNGIAAVRPVNGTWETDYWKLSTQEIDEQVQQQDWAATEYRVEGGNLEGERIPSYCAPGAAVTRQLYGQEVLMMWAARCPLPFAAYPPEGLDYRPGGNDAAPPNGSWYSPGPDGVTARGRFAVVGIQLPPRLQGGAVVVAVRGSRIGYIPSGAESIDVTVNGTHVGVLSPTDPVTSQLRVPADVAAAAGEGRLAIAFEVSRGQLMLGFTLLSLGLDPV